MIGNSIVSWAISDKSAVSKGGSLINPEWREIEGKLLRVLTGSGTVTLDTEDEGGCSCSLQVRAEAGMFVITFGAEIEGDWIVRAYRNQFAEPEKVLILGDVWSARAVCNDSSVVMVVFDEFFNTGHVSERVLPY